MPAAKLTLKEQMAIRKAERQAEDAVKQVEIDKAKAVQDAIDRKEREKKRESERKRKAREKRKRVKISEQRRKLRQPKLVEKQKAQAAAIAEATKEELVRRELASRALARKYLMPFILRQHANYQAGWIHKDVAMRLERFSDQVARGESPRLMLQMPPRTGKSQEASIYFPSWHLGRHPEHEFITCSYSGSLAMGFSRKVRGLLRDEDYKLLFPKATLDKDNQNAEGWQTSRGGGFVPAGVGGPITGKGAHVLLIDDPVKNAEEAESATVRQSVKDWYASTAYTRLAPGGGVLVIQTRWHEDDLSGWLEQQMIDGEGDDFEIVRYPAIAIEDEKYRFKGEALHPERYDETALARIKKAVGPRVWDALYQQQPTSQEGGYFTSDMMRMYTPAELPPEDEMVMYTAWDFAIGKLERNDFTVGLTVGVDKHDNIWLVGLTHGRYDTFEMAELILDNFERYHPRLVGMEKGHISMSLGPYLEKRIAERKLYDFPMHELSPGKRDKELRARAIQGRCRQGKVFFPSEASWIGKMRQEMFGFPFAKHDDIVDVLAWIGLMLQDVDTPMEEKEKKKPSWKDKLAKYYRGQTTRGKSAMTA